jgi:hypothetical protein
MKRQTMVEGRVGNPFDVFGNSGATFDVAWQSIKQ